jgi:hypothetical protein
MSGAPQWDAEQVKQAALPYLPSLLAEWGVRLTGKVSQKGWAEAHAIDREDSKPSAGVSLENGIYVDRGGNQTLSILELAVALKVFPDFSTAVNSLGERLGVPPKTGQAPPRKQIEKPLTVPVAKPTPPPKVPSKGHATFAAAVEWATQGHPEVKGFEVVAEYRYSADLVIVRFEEHDQDGRRTGKVLRPFHKGNDGRWRMEGQPKGQPYPLFGAADIPDTGVIHYLEGEKCQEIATSIGLAAVSCAFNSAAGSDQSKLAGREVAILRDAGEAGLAFAERLAKFLEDPTKLSPPARVRIILLPGLEGKDDIEQFVNQNPVDCSDRIEALVASAFREGTEPPPIKRTPIEVNTERHRVVDESIKALASDPSLYRRGDRLVTVIKEESNLIHLTSRTCMKGVAGSPKIVELAEPVIGERLSRFIEFFHWRKDKSGEFVTALAHPPDWLSRIIASRKHWPGIRPLVAVAECPFPRPDGSIVDRPGYDESTAVYYSPSIGFPEIPLRPTRADARQCWARIARFVRHFPFAGEDDRVVYLAGAFNVLARHGVIGPMPGVAVNGNKAGTGKGLMIDAMTIPGTGRIAPVSKYPYDDQEAGKVKTSIVRSGKTVVSFDNLAEGSRYGGEDVDSLLTARITDDRILGSSENTGEMIVRIACFVNGNNIESMKDAWRRWMVINLVTNLEHPEQRDDIKDEDGNPEKDIDVLMLENRGEIVRDMLTILRAHALEGWPNGGWAPLGSFGDWDRVVRGAVWFATDRDCLGTQRAAAEASQDRRDKLGLLEGFWELPGAKEGERGVTASEAVALVESNPNDYQTLRAALVQRGHKGKVADSKQLGNILRGMHSTPIGSYKLIKHPILKHQAVAWIVEKSASEGESGDSGESF